MSEPDPLLAYLQSEVERIAREWPLERLLAGQVAGQSAGQVAGQLTALDEGDSGTLTLSGGYRYTWQEVERGRRYVIPLDADRAVAAKRRLASEIAELGVGGAPLAVSEIARTVEYRSGMNAYSVRESVVVRISAGLDG